MKLNSRWLATVSLTTLVLVAAGSLAKTSSQQLWSPEVAHAARVTASLLKGQSMRPVFLRRSTSLASRSIASVPLPLTYTALASYTLNQPFSSDRSHLLPERGKQQTYQIKQLEFQLAQEHYKAGKITQFDLDEKAASYQQATQEFKEFINSYKMAD